MEATILKDQLPLPPGQIIGKVSGGSSRPSQQLTSAEVRLLQHAGLTEEDLCTGNTAVADTLRNTVAQMRLGPNAAEIEQLQAATIKELPPLQDIHELPPEQQAELRSILRSGQGPVVINDLPERLPETAATAEPVTTIANPPTAVSSAPTSLITGEDRLAFIESVWQGKPFQRAYPILDGHLVFLLRELTTAENNQIARTLDASLAANEIVADYEYQRLRDDLRMTTAMVSVRRDEEEIYLAGQGIDLRSVLVTDSLWQIALQCYRHLRRLLEQLEQEAGSPNFT